LPTRPRRSHRAAVLSRRGHSASTYASIGRFSARAWTSSRPRAPGLPQPTRPARRTKPPGHVDGLRPGAAM
jgi:hypothetical protein